MLSKRRPRRLYRLGECVVVVVVVGCWLLVVGCWLLVVGCWLFVVVVVVVGVGVVVVVVVELGEQIGGFEK